MFQSQATESSVYVITDFPIEIESRYAPIDEWIRIGWNYADVIQVHPPRPEGMGLEGEESRYVEAIRKYSEARLEKVFLFLKEVKQDFSGIRIGYDIYIHKRIVKRFCHFLPKPFLVIRFKCSGPSHAEDKTTYEKRLELTDLRKEVIPDSSGGYFERQRLVPPQGLSSTLLECDVIVGWREASPQPVIKLKGGSLSVNLFGRDSSKDVVIVAGNGAEIRCHKLILEAHSEALAAMLSPNNGMKSELGRIVMTENSEEGISHLVRYPYGMELKADDIPCGVAVELFKTAHKYKLEQLVEALNTLLQCKGTTWYTPNDLVDLYFHVKNLDVFKDMQEHAIYLMLCFPEEIRACERFEEIEQTDAKAALELVWKLFDKVRPIRMTPTGCLPAPDEVEDE